MKCLVTLSVGLLCFFNASLLLADDCRGSGTPLEELKLATLVFSGKVIEIDRFPVPANPAVPAGAFQDVAKFKVDKWWKGGGEEISIPFGKLYLQGYSIGSGSTIKFEKGEEYLIYAYGEPFNPRTDKCTRTKRLSDAQEDLAALKEGSPPKAQTECPIINIRNRILDASTASWTFEVYIRNINSKTQLSYKWWYLVGNQIREIKSGQNTSKIIVENVDPKILTVVFVLIDGIPAGCNNSVGQGAIS